MDEEFLTGFRVWLQRYAHDAEEALLPEIGAVAESAAELLDKLILDQRPDGRELSSHTVALMLEEMVEHKLYAGMEV